MLPPERQILISPFSNSSIRDWPIGHFTSLVGLLLDRLAVDVRITITGTQAQRVAASEIVRPYHPMRVGNACGQMTWPEMIERVKHAACTIGNNSGVTHLSGFLGVPTVCIFGGSHQREEWRPRGPEVLVVSRVIGCSPCQLDHGQISRYDKACLRLIEPATVADAVLLILAKRGTAWIVEKVRMVDGLVSQ